MSFSERGLKITIKIGKGSFGESGYDTLTDVACVAPNYLS